MPPTETAQEAAPLTEAQRQRVREAIVTPSGPRYNNISDLVTYLEREGLA